MTSSSLLSSGVWRSSTITPFSLLQGILYRSKKTHFKVTMYFCSSTPIHTPTCTCTKMHVQIHAHIIHWRITTIFITTKSMVQKRSTWIPYTISWVHIYKWLHWWVTHVI